MSRVTRCLLATLFCLAVVAIPPASGQRGKDDPKKKGEGKDDKRPPFGFGGFGGPMGGVRKVLEKFDKNKDGWLNTEERAVAREWLEKEGKGGFGKGGFGKGGFGKGSREPAKPGAKVSPDEVATYPREKLYAPHILRTIFLEFEAKDWEPELEAFHKTDVAVPATMTVDGKKYPNVGVHFRGMSSYGGVSRGWKRSLDVSMDLGNKDQRLYGYKKLNLLNAHDDPSFLHSVLYSELSNQSIPTPKANLVKVVINGESWGVFANQQQFDKVFAAEAFGSKKADRWKVQGSPGGRGGLEYLGDKVEDYKRRYTIKSDDNPEAWNALIKLCKVLTETPPDRLEAALKPILDIDGALWFLALDVALVNMDGYWVRASDFSVCRDKKGKFHLVPHDMNETFSTGMGGPGMGKGPGGPGMGKGPGGPGGRPGGFRGPGGGMIRPFLEAADTDKDGKLTSAELLAAIKAFYKTVEQDKEGAATVEALEKALEKVLPKPMGFGGFTPPSPTPMFARSIMEKAGKDGKVTEKRLTDEAAKQFATADRNKDGKLDEEEMGPALFALFAPPGGPGGPGGFMRGPGGPGGVRLDPLVGLNDSTRPLRSKLLAVPALKERYLKFVKQIAQERLDWKNLGPRVKMYRDLIDREVEADTKKLYTLEAYRRSVADTAEKGQDSGLRGFADARRKFLLEHPEIVKLAK
jgi:Ca2+-binding EF-hand superfamily protein